jgi:hypothetical protein
MKMKRYKTPGVDQISVELLQDSPSLLTPLHQIITESYLNNEIPPSWHQGITVQIPKKKNPRSADDLRGITMLSTGYKLATGLLMNKIIPIYL